MGSCDTGGLLYGEKQGATKLDLRDLVAYPGEWGERGKRGELSRPCTAPGTHAEWYLWLAPNQHAKYPVHNWSSIKIAK